MTTGVGEANERGWLRGIGRLSQSRRGALLTLVVANAL